MFLSLFLSSLPHLEIFIIFFASFNNATANGGCFAGRDEIQLLVNNVTFSNNVADQAGGGIYASGNTYISANSFTITYSFLPYFLFSFLIPALLIYFVHANTKGVTKQLLGMEVVFILSIILQWLLLAHSL